MASRKVEIRATLRADQFRSQLRSVGRTGTNVARLMGDTFRTSLKKGFSAGGDSIKKLKDQVGGLIKTAATLGGALSFGALAKDALHMQRTYRDISFNLRKVGHAAMSWQAVQELIEGSADRTGAKAEDVAAGFRKVFEATGDLQFAKESLDEIGTAAVASGESVELLADVAQLLQRKFGMASDEVGDSLARVIEKANVGGKALSDFAGPEFADVLGEAAAAGFKGQEGLSKFLGLLVNLDSRIGEKSTPALKQLFMILRDGSSQLKNLEKQGGVKFEVDETLPEKIEKILQSPKARKAAELIITGDARVIFDELAKPFDKAVEEAKTAGKKGKELKEVGVRAFEQNIESAGKSTLRFKSLMDEASARRAEDPMQAIDETLEKVKRTFGEALAKPETQDAMKRLAESLPQFADVIASIVEFASNHPLLAVGGAAAATAAPTAVTAGVGAGASFLAGKAGTAIKAARAAKVAGAVASGLSAVTGGATAAGAGAGAAGAGGAAAAAGGAGLAVTAGAGLAAAGGVAAALHQAYKLAEEASGGFSLKGLKDTFTTLMRGPAKGASGEDYDRMMERAGIRPAPGREKVPEEDPGAKAAAQVAKKLEEGGKVQERTLRAQERAASAAERLARALEQPANMVGPMAGRGPLGAGPAGGVSPGQGA